MNVLDVAKLTNLINIEESDFIHVVRKNEFGSILSYKSETISLSSTFSTASEIQELRKKIEEIKSNFEALSASFITKAETDKKYVSKETMDNTTPSLLTYSNMESLTANYATTDKANAKAADARKEANRLADEMTDFTAAAMVGINQSGMGATTPTTTEGEKTTEKKTD